MADRKLRSLFVLSFAWLILSSACSYSAEDESPLFWPPPPAPIRISFVRSIYSPSDIGIKPGLFKKIKKLITGTKREILNKPVAVAIDKQGIIYVCDAGMPTVHIFNRKKQLYKKITEINNEELLSPVGIAVSDNGLIFIADSGLKKVFCLDREGRFKFAIGQDKEFLRPTSLAVRNDRLYVVDTAAHCISIFDLSGKFILQFGSRGKGDGEFNYPTSIAIDTEGKIYIADTLNFRIQVLNQANEFLYSIGQPGDSPGSFSRPKGIAVDSFGHIYVTDGMFDNMQIFSQKKEFLLSLGSAGHQDGEFWIPCGLAIDRENYIYVADSYNQRIQVFHYIGRE